MVCLPYYAISITNYYVHLHGLQRPNIKPLRTFQVLSSNFKYASKHLGNSQVQGQEFYKPSCLKFKVFQGLPRTLIHPICNKQYNASSDWWEFWRLSTYQYIWINLLFFLSIFSSQEVLVAHARVTPIIGYSIKCYHLFNKSHVK